MGQGGSGQLGAWPSLALLRLKRFTHFKRNLHLPLCFQYQHCSLFLSHSLSLTHSLSLCVSLFLPHSGRCIQETQTGTQQRPVNGFRRHHIARKWTFLAESARRPHPNHSILPNASQTKTSNHIHTGQYTTPPPPIEPLLRHLFKHPSLPLSLSPWPSACARSEKF